MGISTKYQKDYSNTNFDNPRILKRKEERRLLLLKLSVALGGVIVSGLLYFLFYSPYFRINSFEITGLKKIKQENIESILNNYFAKRKYIIFSRKNYWLIDREAIKKEISRFYYFERLDVRRKFPNRLVVDVIEKQPLINWTTKELCFNVDMTGSAIGYCEKEAGLLTVRDLDQKDVEIAQLVIDSEKLMLIIDLHERTKVLLKEKYNPLYYELKDNLITAKSDAAPEIRFNLDLGVGEQVGRLDLIARQPDLRDEFNKLKYIDLRFGDKVYYQ